MKETAKSSMILRYPAQVTVKVVMLIESQEEEQTGGKVRDPGRHPGTQERGLR